jgi:hypothetical protein
MATGFPTSVSALNQAKSNESAADLLAKNQVWDWAVSVRFYAALHYVEHRVFPFPLESRGVKLKLDPGSYAIRLEVGPHEARCRAVRSTLGKEVGAKYRRLWEMSSQARYKRFAHTQTNEANALRLLDVVKKSCLAKRGPTPPGRKRNRKKAKP